MKSLYNGGNNRKAAITIYESILYPDPQAAKPTRLCPRCGGECYAPSLVCLHCERRLP